MPEFIKGSKLVSIILKFVVMFANAYDNSNTKNTLASISNCFKASVTHKILSMYANKKPWYRYSFVYRLVHILADVADKLLGGIYKLFKYLFKGSITIEDGKKVMLMSSRDKCYCVGVLLISLPVGALLASIVFKSATMLTFVMCWTMFFAGILIVLVAEYGKDSIIIKLIRHFIAIIK